MRTPYRIRASGGTDAQGHDVRHLPARHPSPQEVGERRTGIRGLEPIITSGDPSCHLTSCFVASLAPSELGTFLFNADGQRDEVVRTLDILLTGV
ncbi:hypothetical protein GCM10011392_37820 [Wenxinia marina]|nr:hypothetical protein GCM10011392_37820 [Wenxinia marina]